MAVARKPKKVTALLVDKTDTAKPPRKPLKKVVQGKAKP